jgi:hypothetical protein
MAKQIVPSINLSEYSGSNVGGMGVVRATASEQVPGTGQNDFAVRLQFKGQGKGSICA